MNTAYLFDVSCKHYNMLYAMEDYIIRRFRPGDVVIAFDYRATSASFIGNPTRDDIRNLAKSLALSGGIDLRPALALAKLLAPECKIVILSDGEFPHVPDENYEIVHPRLLTYDLDF